MYPYGIPSIAGHEPSQTQYPPPPLIYPLQDPQVQYYFVQAVQHLSYLMSGSVPGFPPPFPQPNWPPITPKHHRRKKSTRKDSSSPPPGGPSSEPSSSRATPNVHRPLYPESYNPAYSSGSLPPSSPPPSSPSSPIWRPKSALRSGSKSRGRRVSFRLDPEELPEIEEDEEQEDEEVVVSDRELSPEIPLAVAYSHSSSKKVKKPPKSPVSSRRSVDEDGREDRDGEMPSSP